MSVKMIFPLLREKLNRSFQSVSCGYGFCQSSVRKWNLKKICLPSQFCRRMGVRIGNQLVRIQSRYPPVHRRIRRKSGLKSMYIGCHILKAFLYRIKSGKSAEHGKMRCPDMSRHIYALRYRFKHDFQQIPAVQSQNRPSVGMDISDKLQTARQPVRLLQAGQQKQAVNLPHFFVLFINRTDLSGEYKPGLPVIRRTCIHYPVFILQHI